jgi:hypothetical protein
MGRTRRKETREDFSRKEEYMRLAASWRYKNDDAKLEEPKGKLRLINFPSKRIPRNSEIDCSACPSGLFTQIVHPCTPSHLASRC